MVDGHQLRGLIEATVQRHLAPPAPAAPALPAAAAESAAVIETPVPRNGVGQVAKSLRFELLISVAELC